MKRRTATPGSSESKHLAAVETNLLASHAALVAHCAVTRYDDGESRRPGWITIKTFGNSWQVEAKDPDACLTLRVVQTTVDDALGLLNLLLESEEAPWEVDPWLQQQAAKGKRK